MTRAKDETEAAQCPKCRVGNLQEEITTQKIERGDATIVFEEVPADVCDTCGEVFVSETVSEELHEIAEAAMEAGVQFDVWRYGTETELIEHYFEKYADLDPLDLKILRHEYGQRIRKASNKGESRKYLPPTIWPRFVAAERLHELRKENTGVEPSKYDFQQLLSSDLQRRVSIAQELIPDLDEDEKKVTKLCQKIASSDRKDIDGDAVRKIFREAGYEGDATGEGKRERDFKELVSLIEFAAKLEPFVG